MTPALPVRVALQMPSTPFLQSKSKAVAKPALPGVKDSSLAVAETPMSVQSKRHLFNKTFELDRVSSL